MFSLDYDEIQLQIKDTAKQFAQEEILPTVLERDINARFAEDIFQKLGELGFMGMTTSPEWGGSGLDTISFCMAIEEISKVDASIAITTSVQNSLVNWIIEAFGTQDQKERFLTKLATGEYLGAYCLSEPEAGSDAREQNTTAEKVEGGWILNGTKNWISTAQYSNVFIIFAQTNKELKHKGIACFIGEKGMPGLEPGLKEDKMGMRSSETSSLGLTNVFIPDSNLISTVGDGFYIAMKGLTGGRIGIAAQAVGIAQGAFELALKYSQERKTMGTPICEHQLIQAKLAQMSMKISAARMLVHKAAYMKDKGLNCNRQSSEAKLFASTIANEVTREAVQIHGGYGYVREYMVEKMMRDAKVTEIYEGTSEIQHLVIAREVIRNGVDGLY